MSLLDTLKEQEVVDFRLIVTLAVVVVLGIGVFIWLQLRGGSSEIGENERAFVCHYDDTEVIVTQEKLYLMNGAGDAIMNRDRGAGVPTRVRCTECNRMSCFEPDPETGEKIAVEESWDLSESARGATRGDEATGNPVDFGSE